MEPSGRHLKLCASIYDAYCALKEHLEREDPHPSPIVFPNTEWFNDSLGGWNLIFRRPETRKALGDLLDTFLTHQQWLTQWSQKHIRQVISRAIGTIALNSLSGADATNVLQAAACSLDEPAHNWYAYFPLGGVYFNGEIGVGDARAFRLIGDEYAKLLGRFESKVARATISDLLKSKYHESTVAMLAPLKGMACVEVRIRGGDEHFLQMRAEHALETTIDFLQIALDVTGAWPPTIIRPSELPFAVPANVMVRCDGEETHLRQSLSHMHRATIAADTIDQMRKQGFAPLLDAMSRAESKRSDLQSALLVAMHWIAEARRQTNRENRVTSAVTAIEVFLNVREVGAPITRDISEGVALLLGSTLDERKRLRKAMSELYGRRSEISHSGSRKISEADEYNVRSIALALLKKICSISKTFSSRKQLSEWLANERISAGLKLTTPKAG